MGTTGNGGKAALFKLLESARTTRSKSQQTVLQKARIKQDE